MADFFKGKAMQKKSGDNFETVEAADHLKGKVVALYFSAHWCPPCRHFTPMLRDFYNELPKDQVEVIFVSSDRSEEDLKSYMKEAHGDWCFLPYGDDFVDECSDKFGVAGIPTLIIIKPDGDAAVSNARSDVQNRGERTPVQILAEWKTKCGL